MTTFRPLLGTYEQDIVVAPLTMFFSASSGGTLQGTFPPGCISWSSTFPIGQSAVTGSGLPGTGVAGAIGVQQYGTPTAPAVGTFQINARDAYGKYLAVQLDIAPSGSSTAAGSAGLYVKERFDLRNSSSGSGGANGTIVFEVGAGSGSLDNLINPTVPFAVNCVIWASTRGLKGIGGLVPGPTSPVLTGSLPVGNP